VDEYYMAHIGEDKYVNDPNAYVTNIKQQRNINIGIN
jgi:hypothetical protein